MEELTVQGVVCVCVCVCVLGGVVGKSLFRPSSVMCVSYKTTPAQLLNQINLNRLPLGQTYAQLHWVRRGLF